MVVRPVKDRIVLFAVHVDERGRTTIPKPMLELLGIQPGGIMVFSREEDGPFCVGKGELKVDIPFLQKGKGRRTCNQQRRTSNVG